MPEEKRVFVEPSAAGPSQRVERDGTVMPGKAHEAKEGQVTNPGVRTAGGALSAPRCPACGKPTLKMRMNAPAGKRMYCSDKKSCGYDQRDQSKRSEGVKVNTGTRIVTGRKDEPSGEKGVKILKQSGPRGV